MGNRVNRLVAVVAVLALGVLAAPGSQAQDQGQTSILIDGVTQSGTSLNVTGTAFHADEPFVVQGTDMESSIFEVDPPELGLDLLEAAIATKTDGTISFRWTVTDLPPVTHGMPQAHYNWTFCLNEAGKPVESGECWWLTVSRMNYFIPVNTEPWVRVQRCIYSPHPHPCSYTTQQTDIRGTGVFDVESKTITVDLKFSDLGGEQGMEVTPIVGFDLPQVPAAVSTAESLNWGVWFRDLIEYWDPYTIPEKTVSLAIAPAGQNPELISYSTAAVLSDDGSYSGTLDVGGRTGSQAIYARACFGFNNCAYTSAEVDIG